MVTVRFGHESMAAWGRAETLALSKPINLNVSYQDWLFQTDELAVSAKSGNTVGLNEWLVCASLQTVTICYYSILQIKSDHPKLVARMKDMEG